MAKDLTPMQAAYWVGRRSTERLGGVAAHLYAEFEGDGVEPDRLQTAIEHLCRLHPMLRLRVDAEGRQHLGEAPGRLVLEVEDLRALAPDARQWRLLARRRLWTGRKLDLARGEAAAFGLTLLPGGACRLHVDTDMIAVDPNSFRLVMEDLARLYEDPEAVREKARPGFFAWLEAMAADADLPKRRARDKAWWAARLDEMPPAPALPPVPAGAAPRSERLAVALSGEERRALERCARELRVTASTLMLGLFAAVLGRASGSRRFRLNVPTFWREPVLADVERIVGEFSNVLILGVDLAAAGTLAALCRGIGGQMTDLIAHSGYPGVSVMRDVSRRQGGMQTAPVVFTAGLDIAGGELFSERVGRVFGAMGWVISQGPQVALDAQVAAFEGGLLVNWDVRLDALPETWLEETFRAYVALAREVAARPQTLHAPWPPEPDDEAGEGSALATERMLTSLLGRLAPGSRIAADTPIAALAPGREPLAALARFVETYIPSCALSPDDMAEHATPRSLAHLVHARSGGASDEVARIFLETIDEG